MSIWPNNYHEHDVKWLREQLSKLPIELKRRAADGYDTVWQQTWNAEPVSHKRENKARFAANTRLRKYVERVTGARA